MANNEYTGDEPTRSETRESWVKLDKPITVDLGFGLSETLEVIRLVRGIKIDNNTGEDIGLLHWEYDEKWGKTVDQIKKLIDSKVTDAQAEIQKQTDLKTKVDAATPVTVASANPIKP